MTGKLYLIPSPLGDCPIDNVIPVYIKHIINTIDIYIAEDVRTVRRYLKKAGIVKPVDELIFLILNEHTHGAEIGKLLNPLLEGKNIGLVSEAGVPAIADPGADIVRLAHEKNIDVIPLTGPSSILLAMMASGLNGQNFAFAGYLPVQKNDRIKQIRHLEKKSETENQTQIFIEAPYRNQHLITDIVDNCNPNTYLCIACDITLHTEYIKTKQIKDWNKNIPDINKRPAIFLIHKF
ncbi:MAG: SAM-dependent methyltransferase [Bacteroidia bacterium]|nr:SAM-dependent methyltransferase [Bacteroidia bacterium]